MTDAKLGAIKKDICFNLTDILSRVRNAESSEEVLAALGDLNIFATQSMESFKSKQSRRLAEQFEDM